MIRVLACVLALTATLSLPASTAADDGSEGALEGEVRGVVVEQQARRDAGRQRNAEGEHEDEAVEPAAALENQDVPEPVIARQHRGQDRHDGDLDDERREQELLRGQELGLLEHRGNFTGYDRRMA